MLHLCVCSNTLGNSSHFWPTGKLPLYCIFQSGSFASLPEMGIASQLLEVVREREIEAQLGQVAMNCEMCKFRLAAAEQHGQGHGHEHGHHHHQSVDPYLKVEDYHQRIWQTP